MSDTIIIPTADAVIQPTIDKIIELRPNAAPYLNNRKGNYWHPVLGFRGQAARMLDRLAKLSSARRLRTATGQDLRDYVASEFDSVPESDKTFALGTATLSRGTDVNYPAADIPKGTRITREQYIGLGLKYEAAAYETLVDIHLDAGSIADVVVPIRASVAGKAANHPILSNDTGTPTLSMLFRVPNLVVSALEVGGGSDGPDDPFVRDFALAYGLGQYGPTYVASKLGALSATGVRHLLVHDVVSTSSEEILIADGSWASSDRWASAVQQSLYDNDLVGFGCKVTTAKVRNLAIAVAATVALRDRTYLAETTDVQLAVQTAVKDYFDGRPDWNCWSTDTLKAAITRAHPKVYFCSSATVKNAATDATLTEVPTPDWSLEQFHYLLPSNGMKLTFTGPA